MTDWEKHFRQRRQLDPDFGTVAGSHTIAELKDLLAAHQYSIDQTEGAFNAKSFELSRSINPAVYGAWLSDWRSLRARWDAARALAESAISTWHVLPDNLSPSETEYRALAQAVQQSWPIPHTSQGDLVDLVGRLKDMGAVATFENMPQPSAGSDADLEVFKAANAVADAAKPTNKKMIYALVGAAVAGLFLPRILRVFLPV